MIELPDGVPPWFVGSWRREWIRRGDAPAGETRIVRDVQTPSVFGSVRIPLARPPFSGARSLSDLSDAELATLVDQDGFAGAARCTGDVVTWKHEIDYQPPCGDDVGRLVRVGPSRVVEHALDGAYVEHWWSLGRGDGRLLAVRVLGADGGVRRILSVVGDHFVYARARPEPLPPAPSLAALVAATRPDRATLLRQLDCEISWGFVRGGVRPWEIRHSTLPWVEGTPLAFAGRLGVVDGELAPLGATSDETWTVPVVTLSPEDLGVWFPEAKLDR